MSDFKKRAPSLLGFILWWSMICVGVERETKQADLSLFNTRLENPAAEEQLLQYPCRPAYFESSRASIYTHRLSPRSVISPSVNI